MGIHGGYPAFHAHHDDLANIATALHDAKYRTALIGKFLNEYGTRYASVVPPGWDTWDALTAESYYNFSESMNGVQTEFSGPDNYQTDVLGRQALRFLRGVGDEPFFLYWAPHAPHTPTVPAPEDVDAYA